MTISKNTIHNGDCVQLLNQIDAGSVDLVFADPPFNIGYKYDVYDDAQQSDDYLQWCDQWIAGVHRALKPDGTFWLAIGDEYAAELKIAAQKIGFRCRSWVIWYYTFGVNCVNGFSRSHTHLFHFVKDPQRFTFNRTNPQIRVQSARQLVYADNRANPNGRLPDNTWITRPQDAPLSFSPVHDTWYFARVAGTFKEREGFHGCQMPEQLLARIIRASSNPLDVVLDPFGGSGTTMCVAKKLGRQFLGFELSPEYAKYIGERIERISVGDPIEGPADPIQSAPSTQQGKRRPKPFDEKTESTVIAAFAEISNGVAVEQLICDPELNAVFLNKCKSEKLGGTGLIWNRYLLELNQAGKLPQPTVNMEMPADAGPQRYAFAAEVAWRLIAIDYHKPLEEILCSPEFAAEFERLATAFGPIDVSPFQYRAAAWWLRERLMKLQQSDTKLASKAKAPRLKKQLLKQGQQALWETPQIYVLYSGDAPIFAGVTESLADRAEHFLTNPQWQELAPDSLATSEVAETGTALDAVLAKLIAKEKPLLNCRLWYTAEELAAN